MDTRKTVSPTAALVFGLVSGVLTLGGCYGARFQMAPRSGGPPPGRFQGSAAMQTVGVGVSAGLFSPNDSAYANGLAAGLMLDLHVSLWLGPNLAVQADFGRCSMVDRSDASSSPGLGGTMTVSPLTVSAVVSLPMNFAYGGPGYGVSFHGSDAYRWRFGVGAGTLLLSHTEYDVPSSIQTVYVTGGAEWILGYGDRFFTVADLYFGDYVSGESGVETWEWDLTSIATVRVGVEFGF